MKKAFTLIEILVTVAIIGMLTVVAIPNLSGYKREVDYRNNVNEIEAMVNNISSMSKNSEQGVIQYKMRIESKKISLIKVYEGTGGNTESEMETILAANKQDFSSSYLEFYCIVPGNQCFTRKSDGTEKLLISPTAEYLDSDLFLTLTDNDFSPLKKSKFYMYGKPLKVTVKNE